MSSLNKVMLIGRLTRAPETRYTNENKAICNITVATSEKYKDKSGDKQERAEFHRVVMFGGLADVADKYLKKGSQVYICGKLQTRKWTDKEGVERYATEIIVDMKGEMVMLGGGGDTTTAHQSQPNHSHDDEFDEVPF